MQPKQFYVTDERDFPPEQQRSLVIFQSGNGDWYVQLGDTQGRAIEGVRLCTSGGASSACPGLTSAIAEAYRAMKAAREGKAYVNPDEERLLFLERAQLDWFERERVKPHRRSAVLQTKFVRC